MNPKPAPRRLVTIGVPVIAFLVGGALATGAAGAPAEPEVRTETETVTEEVEVAPQSCIDALGHADTLMGYFGEALESAGDAIMYATSFDLDSLDAETAKLEELTPKVQDSRASYDTAAAQCEATAA